MRALPDGRIQWVTPTGHRYHSRPHDYRDEPDPPTVEVDPGPAQPEPAPPPRWSQQDLERFLARGPDDDQLVPDDGDPPPF